MTLYSTLHNCRLCQSAELSTVMDFGEQYIASAFVPPDTEQHKLATVRVPLSTVLCDDCGLLQLGETVDRGVLFDQYFYRSATNPMMQDALKNIVEELVKRTNVDDGIFLDVGCNDGSLLSFVPGTFRRVGVEPSNNITWDHLDSSIMVLNDFFSKDVVTQATNGAQCNVVTTIAMLYSVDKLNEIVEEIRSILAPNGMWCIQVSYLPTMLESMSFYDVCHEHLYYFSIDSLTQLLDRAGLKIIDASLNDVNGGSLRAYVVHQDDARPESQAVIEIRASERELKLNDAETYRAFFDRVRDLKKKTTDFIKGEADKGKLTIGLGASTKGNVLLQFFDLDKSSIPYISERNPDKVSYKTLGTDIALISEQDAREMNPSYMFVLIWFFKEEIIRREKDYLDSGGKLLFPMPYPHFVSSEGETKL